MATPSSAKKSRPSDSSSATPQSQESRQEQENNHGLPQFEQDIQLVRTCTQTPAELDQLQRVMDVAGNQSIPRKTHWLNEKLVRLMEGENGRAFRVDTNCVFVMTSFTGAAFEMLMQAGASVFSPYCALAALRQGIKLPVERGCAITNIALVNAQVCCSNMPTEHRHDIFRKVQKMGGLTSTALTATCTHLITPVVTSAKYHAAKENGIKVVLPGWVDEIYRLGMMTDHDYSDDAELATKFATPIFAGVSVSVSQASQPERLEIKTLMIEHGGIYGDDFTRAKATHLICDFPAGNKYAAAGVWMVPVVRSQWIYDSVKKGYCLDYGKYLLEGLKVPGTPVKSKGESLQTAGQEQAALSNVTKECVVCVGEPATVAFIPCGHRHTCSSCAKLLFESEDKSCPSCREKIERCCRIFL